MVQRRFCSVYSFFCALITSFVLCIFPFGSRIFLKYCYGYYSEQSHWETWWPYFTAMSCSMLLNMCRVWCYQCDPRYMIFLPHTQFHKAIENRIFD